MAWELPIQLITAKAGEDLSAAQYRAVKFNANGEAVKAGAAEAAIGILQNAPKLGEYATIMVSGISKAVIGAVAVTPGTKLTPDANGALEAATPIDFTTSTPPDPVIAIAVAAAGAGAIGSVLIDRG